MATQEKMQSPGRLKTFEEFLAGDKVYKGGEEKEDSVKPVVPSEDDIEDKAEKDAEKDIAKKDGEVQAGEAGAEGDAAAVVANADAADAEEDEEDAEEEEKEAQPEA